MRKLILVLMISMLVLVGCSGSKVEYKLTSDQVIEKFKEKEDFLIYFSQKSCSACQVFNPVYEEVRDAYPGALYMIDFAEEYNTNKEALETLLKDFTGNINVTPTVLVVVDGEIENNYPGIMKYSELESALKNYKFID